MSDENQMEYAATLEVSVPESTEYFRGRPFFRVVIAVTAVTDLPDAHLFVHQRRMLQNGQYRDEFVGVAGPVDMVDLSDEPNDKLYLRKSEINMLLESHQHYQQLVELVQMGVKSLIDGLHRLNKMQTIQTIEIT
jgi:hypothetical protein